MRLPGWSFFVVAILAAVSCLASQPADEQAQAFFEGSDSRHTNNWAVLVCTSRFWFNYRHMANTLAMYRTIKRLGIPDSNIILMLADDAACNGRNVFPAAVYANAGRQLDLYGDSVEVDYRGYEVTVESFLRLLTGRLDNNVPPNKRLLSDASSNVLIYMSGHGGDEFLKFQDNEEMSAFDIADAVQQMWEKRRYNKLLFVIDTCQANTMYSQFYSPNVIATGSSELGENSLSHHSDSEIGVAVIDAFTHFVLHYLEGMNKTSKQSLQSLFDRYDPALIYSHAGTRTDLSTVSPAEIMLTDFFGGVARVEVASGSRAGESDPEGWETSEPASEPAAKSQAESPSSKPYRRLHEQPGASVLTIDDEWAEAAMSARKAMSAVLLIAAAAVAYKHCR